MAFDRSKYQGKGVSLSKINEGVSEAEKNSKSNFSGGSYEKTVYHTVADGANWFKIAPAHDPDDSPYVPMAVSKLNCEVDVYKDGEPTGEKEVKQKNVFIATVHSPKDSKGRLLISKDPVELYLDYLFKKANDEIQDKDERKDYLKHVTGFWGKDGKWVGGIKPDHKLATWAWDKQGQIGRFDISKPWFKDMEKLSLNETAEEVIQTDIFTDLVEGYPVIITKERTGEGKAKKTKYTVDADRPKKRESFDEFCERIAISDKSLEEWEAKKSLKELFVGVYSQRDFDLAMDGLERFDSKNKYGIFENQDFLDEIEEIQVMLDKLPKKEEKEVKEEKPVNKKDSKPTKKEEKSAEDVSPIKMKKFLREYIETNYDEDTELPDLTPKELKKWYELALKEEELPFNSGNEKPEENPTEDEDAETIDAEEVSEEELEKQLSNLRRNRGK